MGQTNQIYAQSSGRSTVLCIDDDPDISHALSIRLGNYNVQVLRAFHGMHGFWLAMTEVPDLIITDIRMPQGEGDYVVECLRNNASTCHIPVVVLTGRNEPGLERRMRNLGVIDFLIKPVDFDDLRERLEDFVDLQENATVSTP